MRKIHRQRLSRRSPRRQSRVRIVRISVKPLRRSVKPLNKLNAIDYVQSASLFPGCVSVNVICCHRMRCLGGLGLIIESLVESLYEFL